MRLTWFHKSMFIVISCILAAGCSAGPAQKAEEQRSFKVMFSDEGYFYQTYGDLFSMRYKNIDIEVVSTQSMYSGGNDQTDYKKAFKDFIDKEQPDLLLLDTDNYETFAAEGKLLELDPLLERDKYDTETIFPGLIEMLKEKGGGKLYGLAPTFYGSVLYYNADLFAKYGVEPPHDGMTWQEILDTARRFPVEGDEKTRVYGFGDQYGNMTFENLGSRIATTQGLKFINPDTMKVTLNTDSWKQAYKMAIDAVESKAVYNPQNSGFQGGTMEEYYQSQPFLMGRMAMTVDGFYLMRNIKEAKGALKDYKPFQLGVVAGPVDPARPDETREVYFGEIFAIRSDSPNADAAWEFLKFVNGDEYAKIKSRSLNNGMQSRMGATQEYDGISLEAFYKLKPSSDNSYRNMEKIPNDFYMQYNPLMSEEMASVASKSKSLDEALQTIESKAQVILDQAVKEAASKKDSDAVSSESTESGN